MSFSCTTICNTVYNEMTVNTAVHFSNEQSGVGSQSSSAQHTGIMNTCTSGDTSSVSTKNDIALVCSQDSIHEYEGQQAAFARMAMMQFAHHSSSNQ